MRNWLFGAVLGIACVFVAFPDAVTGRRSLVPSASLAADPVFRPGFVDAAARPKVWDPSGILVHYPAHLVAARELRAGRAPLWNPYVAGGLPLLAEAHSAPLSPFFAPFWLAPSETTWTWSMLLRLVVAAAATFAFARARGQGAGGAALAAVTYAIGGCAMSRFDMPTEGTAYALLPIGALAADRVATLGWRALPALAIAIGVMIYAAHPELAALAGGAAVLFAGVRRPADPRTWRRLLAALALGVGLGAVVVVPFLEYLTTTGTTYKTSGSLASQYATDLAYVRAAPDVVRLGAAPLLLAALALVAPRRREGVVLAARALAAAAGLALALYLAAEVAPGFYRLLVPPKYTLFLVVFGVALLAGEGLQAARDGALPPRRLAAGAAAAFGAWLAADALTGFRLHRPVDVVVGELAGLFAALAVALAPAPWRRRAAWGAVAVTALALAVSGRRVVLPATGGVPVTPAAAVVRDRAPAPARVVGVGPALVPNAAILLGSSDARALAAIFPRRYRDYMLAEPAAEHLPAMVGLRRPRATLVDLLGAELVLTPGGVPGGWEVLAREGGVTIARNPAAAPRAFVPRELVFAAGPAESLATLRELAAAGRLPDAAVVEAPPGALPPRAGPGAARIVEYEPSRVVLEVELATPGLVVLSDTWDPGWTATVDGARAAVYAVDHLFRGVPVAEGRHRVVLSYEPASFSLGVGVAALSLAVVLAIGAVAGRRARGRAARGA